MDRVQGCHFHQASGGDPQPFFAEAEYQQGTGDDVFVRLGIGDRAMIVLL
ncbi:MAG: hypothetical protein LKM38_14770 [Pseudomonas veronii]|jgi:hypothetical protein|nr:hypothetical protein [Pseudomonas veronii]